MSWLRLLAAVVSLVHLVGCYRDPYLTNKHIRPVVVKDITLHGQTLDEKAEPKQVMFALLQTIKADLAAGMDQKARQEIVDHQLDLCAPDTIYALYKKAYPHSNKTKDEAVYQTVWYWTPITGHYAESFDTDFETFAAKCKSGEGSNVAPSGVTLYYPASNPKDHAKATLKVSMVKESGHWRIVWIGYLEPVLPLEQTGTAPTA